jgi:opacity protein-like surface antigen
VRAICAIIATAAILVSAATAARAQSIYNRNGGTYGGGTYGGAPYNQSPYNQSGQDRGSSKALGIYPSINSYTGAMGTRRPNADDQRQSPGNPALR